MGKTGKFFGAMFSEWGSGLSSPFSVPFAVLALFATGAVQKIAYGCLAAILGFVSAYRIWSREHERAEALQKSLAKPAITSNDWKELAAQIQSTCLVVAVKCEWTCETDHKWNIWGGDHPEACKAWLTRAGAMLLESPRIKNDLPQEIRSEPDDFVRWCLYLKSRGEFWRSSRQISTSMDGVVTRHFDGSIEGIGMVSAHALMEFAAKEFAPHAN